MKDVKGIGFTIPSEEEDYLSIDSFSSLSETDIAIFCPNLSTTNYSNSNSNSFLSDLKFEGKILYNSESSTKIKEHIKHWNKELLNFVSNGGTLFVVLCEKQDFFIYSGTKEVSGTGKSQKVTDHVAPLTNYNFLPFNFIEFHSSIGKNVYTKKPEFQEFSNQFKDLLNYQIYLKSEKIENPIFSTKKGDRILGANLKLKNGYLIFIPNISLNLEKYFEYNEESGDEYWNKEGIRRGKIFINSLVQIDKVLRKTESKSPIPEWIKTAEFNLKKSKETEKIIEKNKKDIELRLKQNEELTKVLNEQESLKDLLFETGKPLENAVIKALHILGYKAENYDDGELELDQVISSPEGDRFIGECEGKDNKGIDISKFRQLQDGLNADFERDEIEEKAFGLLFGNPQRLKTPNERAFDFTNKCKSGAKREQIGLIKTVDLFKVCKFLQENKSTRFAKKCRQAIKNQLGEIIVFPEIKMKN